MQAEKEGWGDLPEVFISLAIVAVSEIQPAGYLELLDHRSLSKYRQTVQMAGK